MARNLVPARALGMTTAWVRTASDFADTPEEGAVDIVVDDTAAWLAAVVAARGP
jgi:putative hydrolase of the HAD superfamily